MSDIEAQARVQEEFDRVFPQAWLYLPRVPWLPMSVTRGDDEYKSAAARGPSRLAGMILGHAVRVASDASGVAQQVAAGNFGARLLLVPTSNPSLIQGRGAARLPIQDGLAVLSARLDVRDNRLVVSAAPRAAGTSQIEYRNVAEGDAAADWQPTEAYTTMSGKGMLVDGHPPSVAHDTEGNEAVFGAAAVALGRAASRIAAVATDYPGRMGVQLEFIHTPGP